MKVFGVSFDTVEAQMKFATAQKLQYDLLADVDGKIIKAFGVPARGRFASRQAYLFKDGKLIWKDEKASTSEQGADLLKALEGK